MKIGYLKYFYILLIVFILSMLGSYAFFSWGSGDNANTNVSFDVVADSVYIYYDAGSNITGADLYPTDDKSDGISKDITVKIDKVVSSKPVTFNLYLDLTDVPTALMNSSFKWALYDGDTQIKTGSITDTTTNCSKNSTKHITLLSGTISSVEEQKYTLYLWIDGNMTNPDTMMNQSFVVNLHADGTNATLVEGNSMSLISLDRNGGNNVNMTLQSLVYNFDSYAISSDGDNEPTNWTDMGCSDGSCDTSKKSIYQKNFNNVDLNYVNGVSYIWLKNTQGNVTKIEIGKNYNITLNNNGATSAGTTSVYGIYKDGFYKDSSYQEKYASTETIVVPTKANYNFSGYYNGSILVIDSKGKFVSGIENKYYDDITLTAKWEANAYKLTYDCTTNGGSTANSTTSVAYNSNVDLSKTCSKSGWTFVGWNTDKVATTKLNSYLMSSSDVTLYAIYSKTLNGKFYYYSNKSTTISKTIYNTATSVSITTPTISNQTVNNVTYSGRGWGTTNAANASVVVASGKSITINSDVTYYSSYQTSVTATFYYSKLSKNDYTYSGAAQGSTTVTATRYMDYVGNFIQSNYTIPSIVSSSTGGASAENYIGVASNVNSVNVITPTTANNVYYAVYTESLTLYYYNGSSHTSKNVTRRMLSDGTNYSNSLSSQLETPSSYDNASFVQWSYDSSNYSSSYYRTPLQTGVNSLYAIYKKSYTITYNANGGSGTPDSQILNKYYISKSGGVNTYNSSIALSTTIPSFAGYTFSGWYTAANGGTKIGDSGADYTPTSSITLYAHWTANTYNLTYDCATNGGSTANSTTSVAYDSNVDLSKTCSKSGWTFVGWNTSSTATSAITSYKMQSTATTLYGIYKKEAITLTAKWNANGASLSTTADSSCTLAAVYNKATQATSCTVTAPTITRSGYTVVGYNTSASSTTNNSSYNTSSKVLTLTSSNTGKTWYVVSYKELSSNFYYYSGTAQTSTSAKCTVYNTTSICTYTLPSVVSSSSGPGSGAYYGVSTAKSSSSTTTTYNSSTSNYYAVYEGKFTVTYKKGDNVDSVGSTSNSCNNKFVSNGSTYSGTSCSITLPVITPSAGFVAMGWYNSSGTKIGNASASATLTSNITLTAKARNLTASELSYDNSATGEDCSDVQCMIDRLDTLIEERYGG